MHCQNGLRKIPKIIIGASDDINTALEYSDPQMFWSVGTHYIRLNSQ
jgi:hypothetical protein